MISRCSLHSPQIQKPLELIFISSSIIVIILPTNPLVFLPLNCTNRILVVVDHFICITFECIIFIVPTTRRHIISPVLYPILLLFLILSMYIDIIIIIITRKRIPSLWPDQVVQMIATIPTDI